MAFSLQAFVRSGKDGIVTGAAQSRAAGLVPAAHQA